MKHLWIILIFIFKITVTKAQITIKGKVATQITNQPLEFATIIVLKPNSEEIITGTTTDIKGEYELKIKPGNYDLKVEFIGFITYEMKNINLENNKTLPIITLKENSEQLDQIEITAEKSTTEYKLDKRVFNVGKDLLSNGGSANDILNNVPSVNVDIEGEVSLRGNAGVRVLINGKPSVLSNNNGLDQIPAETIEKIEIITNPSAKYDAQGTAGIINIILNKSKTGGFSSSLKLTTGSPANHSINYNANYKTEKFNLFTNVKYSDLKFIGEGDIFRTNYDNNTISSFLDQEIDFIRKMKIFNLYIGSDFYFNEQNTTTFSYSYFNIKNDIDVDYIFNFLDEFKNTNNLVESYQAYFEPQIANVIELNHVKTFKNTKQKLTFDFQYTFWNDDENEYVETLENNSRNTVQSRDIESSKDFLFQTDFKLPITEKSHIELGIKGEIRDIDSDYEVLNNNISIDSLSNLFQYKERIYGAYAQFGNNNHKLSYLIGLRLEKSNTGSTDRNNFFKIDKNYTKLFPTLHLIYNFNPKTNVQVSYSRRIRRPSFRHLNPFGGIADSQNIETGNPDLDPMFTNSFDIGFLQKWKKLTLNPSIYYQKTTQLFETQVTENTDGILISQPINSGTENRFGAELALQFSPFKWWQISNEYNFYTFNQKGVYTVEDSAWSSKLNSRIKTADFNFQTSINYNGEINSGQTVTKAIYWANIGFSKDFLDDKITATLNIQNIFDSRIRRQLVTGEDYEVAQNVKFSGRRFGLTIIYRFNRNKKDKDRLPD